MKLLSQSVVALALGLASLASAALSASNKHSDEPSSARRRHFGQRSLRPRAGLPEAGHGLNRSRPIRGVNLGNWLITESWMEPSFYLEAQTTNSSLNDERRWILAHANRTDAYEKLRTHYTTYLQDADFKLMKSYGLNAVRIPVPYWTLEDAAPANSQEVYFFKGGRPQLRQVMLWCKKYGLDVTLDLHALPGSQNAFDNSGSRSGIFWQTKQSYYDRSIQALNTMVDWYVNDASYGGIVKSIIVANEPVVRDGAIPLDLLKKFYIESYQSIRNRTSASAGASVNPTIYFSNTIALSSTSWLPWFKDRYADGTFKNGTIGMDLHKYQAFSPLDQLSYDQHIDRTCKSGTELAQVQAVLPVMVGEMSDGVSLRCTDYRTCKGVTMQQDINTLNNQTINLFSRRYWEAQRVIFEKNSGGWYFWSWKTVSASQWSYQDAVKRVWLPADPNERVFVPNATEVSQGLCVSRLPNRSIQFRTTSP
ncbi:hypothetical protein V8E36_002844 [Tilletia maclaganii]